MALTATQFLSPAYVQATVSRLKVRNQVLQNIFGMGLPGVGQASSANTVGMGGRDFGWDIFDDIRDVADNRMPGVAPEQIGLAPIGHVQGRYPRIHEKISLPYEEINKRRRVGSPPGTIDEAGQRYIAEQEKRVVQRVVNNREFMIASMLRGSMTMTHSGDRLIPAFSGGTYTLSYQVPAGNLSQLNMLGAGDIINVSWATVATADIANDLYQIDAAMQELHGMRLRHVIVNHVVWNHIQNNAKLQALAGSANRVFQSLTQHGDGQSETDFTAVLAAVPWVTIHVVNEVLKINGTVTKLIADTQATFLPEVDGSWAQFWHGSEYVVVPGTMEDRGDQVGFYSYAYKNAHPAGYEFVTLFNGLPALFVPKAIATGTVVF